MNQLLWFPTFISPLQLNMINIYVYKINSRNSCKYYVFFCKHLDIIINKCKLILVNIYVVFNISKMMLIKKNRNVYMCVTELFYS